MWMWRCGSGASWPGTGRAAEWRLKRHTGVAAIGSAPRAPRRARGSSWAKVAIPVVAAPWRSSSSSAAPCPILGRRRRRRTPPTPTWGPSTRRPSTRRGCRPHGWSPSARGCPGAVRHRGRRSARWWGARRAPALRSSGAGATATVGPSADLHVRTELVALAGVVRLPLTGVLLVVGVVVRLHRDHDFLGSEHWRTPNYLTVLTSTFTIGAKGTVSMDGAQSEQTFGMREEMRRESDE